MMAKKAELFQDEEILEKILEADSPAEAKKIPTYRGKGCPSCRNTGYKGRIGLHELLLISDEIKKLIHTRATATELFKWRGRRK